MSISKMLTSQKDTKILAALNYAGQVIELIVIPVIIIHEAVWPFIIMHLAAVIFIWLQHKRRNNTASLNAFCFILTVFFPIFGIIAEKILLNIIVTSSKMKGKSEDKSAELFTENPDLEIEPSDADKDMLESIRRKVDFESFIDIINGPDPYLKGRVIAKLAFMFSKESVNLLRQALRDDSHEVKLYASAALVKMDDLINKQINMALKKSRNKTSTDTYNELGNIYRIYAESGLTGKVLSEYYFDLAIQAYQKSLEIDHYQPDVITNTAGALLARKKYDTVNKLLGKACAIWPSNTALFFLYAESMFYKGNFSNVSKILSRVNPNQFNAKDKDILKAWKIKNGKQQEN